MALGTESGGGIWLSVVKGHLTQRVSAGTEGAVERVLEKGPNTGATVHELQFNFLEGRLERVYIQDTEYGKSWVFVVSDDIKTYNLVTGYSSGYAVGLLGRLPNVDLSDNIRIKSFYIRGNDDKFRGYLTIQQGGQKVEKAYTKEEPNGLPEIKQVEVNGEKVWDSTDRMKFFEKLVEKINAAILKINPLADQTLGNFEEETPDPDIEDAPPEENDGLPF